MLNRRTNWQQLGEASSHVYNVTVYSNFGLSSVFDWIQAYLFAKESTNWDHIPNLCAVYRRESRLIQFDGRPNTYENRQHRAVHVRI